MTDHFQLTRSKGEERSQLYQGYLAIKYRIFVGECGWALPCDKEAGEALSDPFDAQGLFVYAEHCSGHLAGVLRANLTAESFPHKKLFEHHLAHPVVRNLAGACATMNALAVLPDYRRRVFSFAHNQIHTTLAKMLVFHMLDWLWELGIRLIILTATDGPSKSLLRTAGFRFIDPPKFIEGFDERVFNMGILIQGKECRAWMHSLAPDSVIEMQLSDEEIACGEYLASQERIVLARFPI